MAMRPEEVHALVLARPWAGRPWARELVEAFPEIGYVDLDPVLVNATGAHVLGARMWLREAPDVRPDSGPRRLRGVTF